ncbi:MAG: MotE family protein [Lachnospiraceae bacterium]
MADKDKLLDGSQDAARLKEEKKKLKEEQKRQKEEMKRQKKEAKKKAKEIAEEESRLADDEGSNFPVIVTTLVIVLVWIAILCALVKLDIGGFGSGVLAPVLKNVPVVNKILPDSEQEISEDGEESIDVDTAGYSSLKEAVKQIKELETQLQEYQTEISERDEQIAALQEEIARLQTFEDAQVDFERIKNEFYNEVVYADNGPGAEEYQKYYESMDPATAEVLYKQVVAQLQEDKEIQDYAQAYSEMKPKEAAGIFEKMTDNLELAARILAQMEPDDRGKILGVMNPEVAAKLTKIMEPDS